MDRALPGTTGIMFTFPLSRLGSKKFIFIHFATLATEAIDLSFATVMMSCGSGFRCVFWDVGIHTTLIFANVWI